MRMVELAAHVDPELVRDFDYHEGAAFLVDSVSLAINGSGRVVHLVIHPIMTVIRDLQGRLLEVHDSETAGRRESWMHVEITRSSDRDDLALLAQTLPGVLADVRVAVEDWLPMRARLKQLYGERHRFALSEEPGGGLAVCLELPFHVRGDETKRAVGAGQDSFK